MCDQGSVARGTRVPLLIPDPLGNLCLNKASPPDGSGISVMPTAGSLTGQLFVALVSHKTSGDSAEQQATSHKLQAASFKLDICRLRDYIGL